MPARRQGRDAVVAEDFTPDLADPGCQGITDRVHGRGPDGDLCRGGPTSPRRSARADAAQVLLNLPGPRDVRNRQLLRIETFGSQGTWAYNGGVKRRPRRRPAPGTGPSAARFLVTPRAAWRRGEGPETPTAQPRGASRRRRNREEAPSGRDGAGRRMPANPAPVPGDLARRLRYSPRGSVADRSRDREARKTPASTGGIRPVSHRPDRWHVGLPPNGRPVG